MYYGFIKNMRQNNQWSWTIKFKFTVSFCEIPDYPAISAKLQAVLQNHHSTKPSKLMIKNQGNIIPQGIKQETIGTDAL